MFLAPPEPPTAGSEPECICIWWFDEYVEDLARRVMYAFIRVGRWREEMDLSALE